jgi:hypothetical protein
LDVLFTDNFYQCPFAATAAKFSVKNSLPGSKIQLAIANGDNYLMTHDLPLHNLWESSSEPPTPAKKSRTLMKKAAGTTILLVEQNARLALQVASRGYVLQSGSVVLSDTSENLEQNEMVREAYLGE